MVVVMLMVKKKTLRTKNARLKGKLKAKKAVSKKKPLKRPKKSVGVLGRVKKAVGKLVRKTVKKKVVKKPTKAKKLLKSKKIVKKKVLRSKKTLTKSKKRLVKAKTTVRKAKVTKKTVKPKTVVKAKTTVKPVEKKPDLEQPKIKTPEQKKIMRGVVKILSDASVRQNLIEIGGENALAIVRNFYGNCSDEELAKKLKIKISDVRATLNKLHNEGLVNYVRAKDSETGWYSYSWSLNHLRMEKWASNQILTLNPHDAEGVDYYFCPSCGTSSITNFESAADLSFRCESCNRMLEFIDEKKMLQLYERS